MTRLAALLTLLHLQNSAFAFTQPEADRVAASPCHPRNSCAPSRNEGEDHLWGNYTCECGRHCIRYGTCCGDSPHAGTTLHVEYRGEKCGRLAPYFSEHVVLVSRCPDRWRYDYRVREMCESPTGSAEDPLSAVPVTNELVGVTYRNYFCAMCNFDARDVRMWDVLLLHETRESDARESDDFFNVTKDYLLGSLSYDAELQSWGIIAASGSFLKVRLLFEVPPALLKVVKKCHPGVVSDCDASHESDYALRYKCLSHYSPVTLRAGGKWKAKKYRNVHCAVCNGATGVEDLTCGVDVRQRKRPSFSFAHLIDINGDVTRGTGRCGANQTWDPFAKKCRSLACALPGYVIENGQCVQR